MARFDPTTIFRTKQSNNLADVDPLLKLLGRCKVEGDTLRADFRRHRSERSNPDLVFADYYLAESIAADMALTAEESEEATGASLARLDEIIKPALAKDKHPSIILMSSRTSRHRQPPIAEGRPAKKVFASRFGFFRKSDVHVEPLPADASQGRPEPIAVIRPGADVLLTSSSRIHLVCSCTTPCLCGSPARPRRLARCVRRSRSSSSRTSPTW